MSADEKTISLWNWLEMLPLVFRYFFFFLNDDDFRGRKPTKFFDVLWRISGRRERNFCHLRFLVDKKGTAARQLAWRNNNGPSLPLTKEQYVVSAVLRLRLESMRGCTSALVHSSKTETETHEIWASSAREKGRFNPFRLSFFLFSFLYLLSNVQNYSIENKRNVFC